MKVFIDHHLRNLLFHQAATAKENFFSKPPFAIGNKIVLRWSSLLECLEIDSLFDDFLVFDEQNDLFLMIKSALENPIDKEVLIRLYDQIFVECLTHVKAIPQVNRAFLLECIQKKREESIHFSEKGVLFESLMHYENFLQDHPHSMHDLILYLAWDRMCVNVAVVFESLQDLKLRDHLMIFKECLLESFVHISAQGKTVPGFFRLIEALYAYSMREENLQMHSEEEWLMLCQSLKTLRPRESLEDVFYVDAAIVDEQRLLVSQKNLLQMFTCASVEQVNADLTFANHMLSKLKMEVPGWHYTLHPLEVFCLKQGGNGLFIEGIVRHDPI